MYLCVCSLDVNLSIFLRCCFQRSRVFRKNTYTLRNTEAYRDNLHIIRKAVPSTLLFDCL
jgi:hypothetical protein